MFNNLGVCIHRVSKQLDTGDIFSYVKIRLTKNKVTPTKIFNDFESGKYF